MNQLFIFLLLLSSFGLSAQTPATAWEGWLVQEGGQDTFLYRLALEFDGKKITGTSLSINPRGDTATFTLGGAWDGRQFQLQEWKQVTPKSIKWCLKFMQLQWEQAPGGRPILQGNWQAEGCRPGAVWLQALNQGKGAPAVFHPLGRWTGHLDQSDRSYGFYYELRLNEGGTGTSRIVSEDIGGTAVFRLHWQLDPEGRWLQIEEEEVLSKTNPAWPWCIKSAKLDLRPGPDGYSLGGYWSGFIEGHAAQDDGRCAPGTMYLQQPVVQPSQQEVVKLHTDRYEDEHRRRVQVDRVLRVNSPKIRLRVWDNGTVDGDVVTIFLNGNQLTNRLRVSKHRWSVPVTLSSKDNLLILHAEDLGSIPPNTVAVSIDDGTEEKIIVMNADMKVSGAVLIQHFSYEGGKANE